MGLRLSWSLTDKSYLHPIVTETWVPIIAVSNGSFINLTLTVIEDRELSEIYSCVCLKTRLKITALIPGFLKACFEGRNKAQYDSVGDSANIINPLYAGIQNGRLENVVCIHYKMYIFGNIFKKSIALQANRLEPRSGPTYVGPDLGTSRVAHLQKYRYIGIPH